MRALLFLDRDRLYRLNDVVNAADAQHRVDLGELVEHLPAVTLGETAGHNNSLERAVLFEPRDVENVVYRLFFGALDERAGVDNYNVRLRFVLCYFVARLESLVQHDLSVKLVLRAAE